ncbi:MAG: hypothetical protein FWH55_03850, partial [Oscillospiraceae bacterium]|nr:hypothetical protein [Oscillospiraceae bacterium]
YSIFYDGNGGTSLYDDLGGYSDSYPLAGQSAKSWNPGYRIPVTTLGNASVVKLNTRPNEFLGWNTKADGTGTMFQPGDVIQEAALGTLATGGAVTFYAQWEILCECELCPICGGCLLGEVCDCMGVDCTCTPCQHMLFEMAVEILKAAKPPVVLPNYKLTPAVTLPQLKAYVEGLVNKGWFEIVIQQKEAGGEYFLVHPDTAWGLEYQIVVELAFQPTHTTEDYDAAIAKAKAFLADSHSLSTPESVNAAKTLLNAFLALDRIAKPDFLMMTYEEQVALAKEILDKIDEAAALLKARLLSATPSAYVTKLTGNQNDLSITVVEKYTYGPNVEYTATLKISNNAAGTYKVGPYNVYVDTKGNTQIKEIYIK